MVAGPGKQKLKYAGSKFKLQIKLGPNGELTAGFKRKKPSFFKKLLKGIGSVFKAVVSNAFNFISNPFKWATSSFKMASDVLGMGSK